MNSIKRFLYNIGLAKYPTSNLYRLKEAKEDYEAAIKLIAELSKKVTKLENINTTQPDIEVEQVKKPRRRRSTKK